LNNTSAFPPVLSIAITDINSIHPKFQLIIIESYVEIISQDSLATYFIMGDWKDLFLAVMSVLQLAYICNQAIEEYKKSREMERTAIPLQLNECPKCSKLNYLHF
jgi:hypothetical protein